jgi:arylsulfatase A-like enzyme
MSKHVVVIAVDGFRASALGAYGNSWVPTPALDHLAAESVVCDWWLAESAELPVALRALWHGRHPLRAGDAASPSLASLLADQGVATCLITDDPQAAEAEGAREFEKQIVLDSPKEKVAASALESGFGQIFSQAAVHLEEADEDRPTLTWVQSRGFYGAWDAPQQLRDAMGRLDETDPPTIVSSPDFTVDDPDPAVEIFPTQAAYAAQLMLLDQCLGAFLEYLNEMPGGEDRLIVLIGTRGFPLGEHGKVGGVDRRLFVEQLHVPCLFRDGSDRMPQLSRVSSLMGHTDLLPTLLDWATGESNINKDCDGKSVIALSEDPHAEWHDSVLASDPTGCRALRTSGWCLRSDSGPVEGDELAGELYVRPDDLWEKNDVAALCREVVEELAAKLTR